jgi:hypothetical protein
MPKPTSYIESNDESEGSQDYNNDAYGYNYIYDYPIGNVPMYFPIRNTRDIDLPKRIYVIGESEQNVVSQVVNEPDYTLYYIGLIALLLTLLIIVTHRSIIN